MFTAPIAVIGAGPYGLACAAHLRGAGIDVHVYGRPMEFWERHMPQGMCLRSPWLASSISDPARELTLDDYQTAMGITLSRPIPLADWLRYAHWYRGHAVPDIDERRVVALHRDGGYRLELDDGSEAVAQRVIMATGLTWAARIPAHLSGLPPELALHASELCELERFNGRRVAVLGAGQSAVESAVLLSEAGAEVELIARTPQLRWLKSSAFLHARRGLAQRLLYPPTDVGPPGLNQLTARPRLFTALPWALQQPLAYRAIRPAVSTWLTERIAALTVTLGQTIARAVPDGSALELTLADGTRRSVDHLVMATGYRCDLARHQLIAPDLRTALKLRADAPRLGRGFESSLGGLHFVGAFAAPSFGPLMRFVSGTAYAATAVAAHLGGRARRSAMLPAPASLSAAARLDGASS